MPSERFIRAVTAQHCADADATLLTLTHANFDAPIRLCTGGRDLISNAQLFKAEPMRIILPGESAELGARRGRVTLDNTTPELVAQLQLATSEIAARLDKVLADWPDELELSWPGLRVTDFRPLTGAIELELSPREDVAETFPHQGFTPRRAPGLFV